MARRRTKQADGALARIQALIDGGGTAESIAKTLKAEGIKGVSRATIGRRILEQRGKQRVGRVGARAKSTAPSTPEPAESSADAEEPASEEPLTLDPDNLPEGMSVEKLHRLLDRADRAASAALATKDLATFGSMGRLVTTLSEAIRKSTPPKPPDPNDSPDMIDAAKRARETLHRLVNQVVERTSG